MIRNVRKEGKAAKHAMCTDICIPVYLKVYVTPHLSSFLLSLCQVTPFCSPHWVLIVMSDPSSSSAHTGRLTPDSLPVTASARSDLEISNTSCSLPSSFPKRPRQTIDWSGYEQATQNSDEVWKRWRIERERAEQQAKQWGSSGPSASTARTPSLRPPYPKDMRLRSPGHSGLVTRASNLAPDDQIATRVTTHRRSGPALPYSSPMIEDIYPAMATSAPATTHSAPSPAFAADVEMDDDDAYLKRLMAQAEQMRQVEEKLGEQLQACTLVPTAPASQSIPPATTVVAHSSIDIMADTRDARRSARDCSHARTRRYRLTRSGRKQYHTSSRSSLGFWTISSSLLKR